MFEKDKCINIYHNLSFDLSKKITQTYSTSFYSATRLFAPDTQKAIHSIYGFVRLADEIVDSFHGFDKKSLLDKFEEQYYESAKHNISYNPILHSFYLTVQKYQIPDEYIQAFLSSMRADLDKKRYTTQLETDKYIYGSADVVGLMCLKVFCQGNEELFQLLLTPAMRLGSAFQKVNFLRDLKEDYFLLGRVYFPNFSMENFDEEAKNKLIDEINTDFAEAYKGIRKLPRDSRLAVTIAYKYYLQLLKKIKKTPANEIISRRIRVSNFNKFLLL